MRCAITVAATLAAVMVLTASGFERLGFTSTVLTIAVAIAGAVTAFVFSWRAGRPRGSIRVRLDRNGRTIVVNGAHPDFIHAVQERERRRLRRRWDEESDSLR